MKNGPQKVSGFNDSSIGKRNIEEKRYGVLNVFPMFSELVWCCQLAHCILDDSILLCTTASDSSLPSVCIHSNDIHVQHGTSPLQMFFSSFWKKAQPSFLGTVFGSRFWRQRRLKTWIALQSRRKIRQDGTMTGIYANSRFH